MTIVVASAAPDGIVLASDSRTTQSRGNHHRVASDASPKVFEAWGRAGLVAYGIATIGEDSIRTVIQAWLDQADCKGSGEELADSLATYLQERLNEATPAVRGPFRVDPVWPLGVLLASYDEDGVGRVREIQVWPMKSNVVETKVLTSSPATMWRGRTDAIRRLVRGSDEPEMKKVGISIGEQMKEQLSTVSYDLIQPITLQDAIDLAYFLIQTTVGIQRFHDGTFASPGAFPMCGGPTQCVAVTPDGVDWVSELALAEPASASSPPSAAGSA
jgi:hypothetical protein